jgi:hypothetical protein
VVWLHAANARPSTAAPRTRVGRAVMPKAMNTFRVRGGGSRARSEDRDPTLTRTAVRGSESVRARTDQ